MIRFDVSVSQQTPCGLNGWRLQVSRPVRTQTRGVLGSQGPPVIQSHVGGLRSSTWEPSGHSRRGVVLSNYRTIVLSALRTVGDSRGVQPFAASRSLSLVWPLSALPRLPISQVHRP